MFEENILVEEDNGARTVNASIDSFVGVYENAFPKEYCEDVIKNFEFLNENGLCWNRQQGENAEKRAKDDVAIWSGEMIDAVNIVKEADIKSFMYSLTTYFNGVFNVCLNQHYTKHYNVLNQGPVFRLYGNKVQRTDVGQGYHIWHFEDGDRDANTRLLTHILYLNDVEEGGETELLYLGKRFKPKAGTLIIFPAGFTHTHRGNPPISNNKYIVTGWAEY
jgi:hypothetical protein